MAQTEPVRQKFRLRAVRRPVGWLSIAGERRVADEEVVHDLWTNSGPLNGELTQRVKALESRVDRVVLNGINDVDGVLVEFEFSMTEGAEPFDLPDVSPAVIAAVAEVLRKSLGQEVAVSASPEPPKVEEADEQGSTSWDRVAPVLATIATGIGVVGFVTFVGGAVVWARLRAAGFPAAPALGIIPSQDLLVIGAETLVPQVIVAGIVVIVLTILYVAVSAAVGRFHEGTSLWMEKQAGMAWRRESGAAMFCFIAGALLFMLLLFSNDLSGTQFVTAIILAAVCAMLAAAVGRATSQLPTSQLLYLGAATFVLVGIFEGYLAYARESTSGQVRGAAVIRDNKKAVVGLFVAEGSDRVYIARVSSGDDDQIDVTRSRLVGIAKDEVTDVAVGERKPVHDALNQASTLAKELCELQPKPPPPANGTIENCRTAPPGDKQP